MANENWDQERVIVDEFKKVYSSLFDLERKLLAEPRQQVFQVRCELGRVEEYLRHCVRRDRDGSTVWLAAAPQQADAGKVNHNGGE